MKQSILEFIDLLRHAGIRISLSETVDCLKGLGYVDVLDRSRVRDVLKATLVKHNDDSPVFDRIFHQYFAGRSFQSSRADHADEEATLMEHVISVLEHANGVFSPEFREIVTGNLLSMAAQVVETGRDVGVSRMIYPLQTSYFIQRIRERLNLDQWEMQLDHLLALLEEHEVSRQELVRVRGFLGARMQHVQAMIKEHVDTQKRIRMPSMGTRSMYDELMCKSFGSLTPREIESMRRTVKELVKRIKDEYGIRERRKRRGNVDLKRTLRKSQQYGGVPMAIIMKRRKKSKARVVALCDVSGSVWNASRFMLSLLYSLQDQFGKVRSFIFVDTLGEVTGFFERYSIDIAIEKALNEAGISYHHYTDYGSVFKEFHEKHIESVNRKTTFIIIGDGRNNFFYPEETALEKIRLRARRVIWLNPEPRGFWGTGDSVMHRYARQCNEVRECRNLSQLMEFIHRLVL